MVENRRLGPVPARELESPRSARTGADRALQEARAAVAQENFLAALAATKGVPERIAEEIQNASDAVEARTGRGQRRRR